MSTGVLYLQPNFLKPFSNIHGVPIHAFFFLPLPNFWFNVQNQNILSIIRCLSLWFAPVCVRRTYRTSENKHTALGLRIPVQLITQMPTIMD